MVCASGWTSRSEISTGQHGRLLPPFLTQRPKFQHSLHSATPRTYRAERQFALLSATNICTGIFSLTPAYPKDSFWQVQISYIQFTHVQDIDGYLLKTLHRNAPVKYYGCNLVFNKPYQRSRRLMAASGGWLMAQLNLLFNRQLRLNHKAAPSSRLPRNAGVGDGWSRFAKWQQMTYQPTRSAVSRPLHRRGSRWNFQDELTTWWLVMVRALYSRTFCANSRI